MYISLVNRKAKYGKLASELNALEELRREFSVQLLKLNDEFITRHELKRDFGISRQALNLAQKFGFLEEKKDNATRLHKYSAKSALTYKALFPGLTELGGKRLRKKSKSQKVVFDVIREKVKK